MLVYQIRSVLISCGLAAMLSMPATSKACGFCDWLSGGSPSVAAQTTYTQPYYAAAYAPPACAAPTCAAPASGCSSCATQVVQYAPYTSYRPIYTALTAPRPVTTYYYPTAAYYPTTDCNSCAAPTTTYYPTAGCNTCAMPVTTYRPVAAFVQQVRLIPYTTYRMAYMPVTSVAYAPACTPCASSCTSSCGSCSAVGYEGATYGSSTCSPCQGAVNSSYTTPSIQTPSAESTQPPKMFQDQKPAVGDNKTSYPENSTTNPDNKPASDPDSNLVPVPETRLNSSPGPQLLNPDNRTTSTPARQAIYLVTRKAPPAGTVPAEKSAGWRESRD